MLALLREDEFAVGDDVELRTLSFDRGGLVSVLLELRREAHGPLVVAASDGAVEDLDPGHFAETLHGDVEAITREPA